MRTNKFIKNNVIKMIDNLYRLSGKKEIPDLKKICKETQLDRQTALKFLYTWWDKYHSKNAKDTESTDPLICFNSRSQKKEEQLVAKALALIQCLSKEIELYSDSLNNLPTSDFPLGNYILISLQDIESQIFISLSSFHELRESKNLIQNELKKVLEENNRLCISFKELENNSSKELRELHEKLDASRRELVAANHKIKSLKRDRRKFSFKNSVGNGYLNLTPTNQ